MSRDILKRVTIKPGGRVDFSDPSLPEGSEAMVRVSVETAEERAALAAAFVEACERLQAELGDREITEEEIQAELDAYRLERKQAKQS